MRDLPKTEKEFIVFMEELDELLRKRNVPVSSRDLVGACEVAKNYQIEIDLMINKNEAIPNNYTGNSFAAHFFNWFENRYGDNMKVDYGPGKAVILIKNDPYKIVFPRIFGPIPIVCDRNIQPYKECQQTIAKVGDPIMPLNVLLFIENLNDGLINALSDKELKEILEFFISSYEAIGLLLELKDVQYIKEARGDLETAVVNIFYQPPQYGLSKWNSLQFIEKMVKAYIGVQKKNNVKTHNLFELFELAYNYGLPKISNDLIKAIQCSPSIRYESRNVKFEEVIASHHASLEICKRLSLEIKKIILRESGYIV
jgi:HEPN domain-containing protein